MNMDNIDLEALQRDLEAFAREQEQRSWFRKNWLWFVPVLLLTVIVLGGGAVYWSLFLRIYRLDLCQAAMRTIQADRDLQKTLGQPIQVVYRPTREAAPSGRIEDDEIDLLWRIEGPNGEARSHLLAKRRQGKWETIVLEVTLPNGRKVSLADAVGGGADDAPPFDAPKPGAKKSETGSPPADIHMLPPSDAPVETNK
jgi:hypothetical protein